MTLGLESSRDRDNEMIEKKLWEAEYGLVPGYSG